ncbi:MAG: hypothetical protein ABIR81_01675, partial [Ginsengibacter sp.]
MKSKIGSEIAYMDYRFHNNNVALCTQKYPTVLREKALLPTAKTPVEKTLQEFLTTQKKYDDNITFNIFIILILRRR